MPKIIVNVKVIVNSASVPKTGETPDVWAQQYVKDALKAKNRVETVEIVK